MLDRLLHHCHIVYIKGNSYRLRQYLGLAMPNDAALPHRRSRKQKTIEEVSRT